MTSAERQDKHRNKEIGKNRFTKPIRTEVISVCCQCKSQATIASLLGSFSDQIVDLFLQYLSLVLSCIYHNVPRLI